MSKKPHLWQWEHEPTTQRLSKAGHSRVPSAASPGPLEAMSRQLAIESRRDRPLARDLKLSELALSWKDSLPIEIRPESLCVLYPRVANRIALCWKDPSLTSDILADLLGDTRGGRKGFPTVVRRELNALRQNVVQRLAPR